MHSTLADINTLDLDLACLKQMQDLMGDQFKPLVEKYLLSAEEKIEKAHRVNMHNEFKQLYMFSHGLQQNRA